MPLTALILNQTYPKYFRPENTPTHNANSKNRPNIDMICITLKKKFSSVLLNVNITKRLKLTF